MAEAAGQHTSERLKTLAVSVPSHSAVPAKIYEIITGTPRRMAESAANFASGALSKFPALVSTPTRNAQIKHAIDKLAERQEEIRAMAQRRIRVYLTAAAGLLLGVAAIALLFLVSAWRTPDSGQTAYETSCRVFCEGPILEAIQMARLFPDSKTFVDMPLLVDPGTVESAFASTFPSYPTVQPTRQELMEFLGKFFAPAGSDMLPWVPDDWTATPAALVSVQNATVRGWLLGLNHLWLSLGRQLAKDVLDHPERHTLLWQPNPLMVPGGRFIETYYWDSLWIVVGLLRCGMVDTATRMVGNMMHLLSTFGFLPNGSRTYYALPGRSQPPLLSSMVREVYSATGNISFLRDAYTSLKSEWDWWMQAGEYGHAVFIATAMEGGREGMPSSRSPGTTPTASEARGQHTYVLNRYVSDQHIPRPESYYEDVHTAAQAGHAAMDPGAQILYSEIAAAAESGWDFTGRWFADGENISSCDTSHVIPVELNTMMYMLESDLATFARILLDYNKAGCAQQAAAEEAARGEAGRAEEEDADEGGPHMDVGSASTASDKGARPSLTTRARRAHSVEHPTPLKRTPGVSENLMQWAASSLSRWVGSLVSTSVNVSLGLAHKVGLRQTPSHVDISVSEGALPQQASTPDTVDGGEHHPRVSPSPTAPSYQSHIVYCKGHPHAPLCQPGRKDVVRDLWSPQQPGGPQHSRASWATQETGDDWTLPSHTLHTGSSVKSEPLGAIHGSTEDTLQGRCNPILTTALEEDAHKFASAAAERARAMEALMWDEERGSWADLRVSPEVLTHTEPVGAGHAVATDRGGIHVHTRVAQRYKARTDLVMGRTVTRSPVRSSSDYVPLWAGLGVGIHGSVLAPWPWREGEARDAGTVNTTRVRRIVESLQGSGLVQPGGIITTLLRTPEQWDWPNAWAPLQHQIIAGLHGTGVREAQVLARTLARRWLRSNLQGYLNSAPQRGGVDVPLPEELRHLLSPVAGAGLATAEVGADGTASGAAVSPIMLHIPPSGHMFEKYNGEVPGTIGGKGEYEPQTGFGWTNGVALDLALRYNFEHLEE